MRVDNLRQIREDQAWSQRDLAARAGVALMTIVRAERGAGVYPRTVRKLAEALGITPRELTARQTRSFDVSKR